MVPIVGAISCYNCQRQSPLRGGKTLPASAAHATDAGSGLISCRTNHPTQCRESVAVSIERQQPGMAGLVRQMKVRQYSKALQMLGAACVVLTSGCATAFVRSKHTVAPQHVFPATAFDGQLFWNSGFKGEPLFATVDPNAKNGPVRRVAYGVGAIIDLPFSIVFDTILLPMDLTQSGTSAEDGPKGEPSTPQELSARAAQFIGRGIRVVEKPGQMHVEAGPFWPPDMVTYEGKSRVYTGVLQAVLNNQIVLAPPEAAPKTFRVRGLFRENLIGPYAHQNDDGISRDQPCSKQ